MRYFSGLSGLGNYTVTEVFANGSKSYVTKYKVGANGTEQTGTAATGTLTQDGLTIAFTNTYHEISAALQADKAVTAGSGITVPDKTFTFNLSAGVVEEQGETSVPMPSVADCTRQVKDGNTAQFGNITYYKTGKYTYTISETEDTTDPDKGWTYNVNGPVTATVEVKENASSGALYTEVSYSPANTDGTAGLITNKYEDGKLKVVKEVQLNGQKDTTANGATFKVGLFETANSTSPIKTETITIGNDGTGSVEFDHLVIGKTYYVYEMNGDQKAQNNSYLGLYKVIAGNGHAEVIRTVTTSDGLQMATINLVNNKLVGDLKIKKILSGNYLTADDDKLFNFEVTVQGAAGEYNAEGYNNGAQVTKVSFTNGVASVSLKGGQELLISGLPNGASYSVVETDANTNGFTSVPSGTSGTINSEKTGTNAPVAQYTNTKITGGLTITKTFAGNTDKLTTEDMNKISFKVEGPAYTNEPGGALTISYSDMVGGTKTLSGIQLGTYTVTEILANDSKTYVTKYKVGANGTEKTGTAAQGELTSDGLTIAFTNTYHEVSTALKVDKTVIAGSGITVPDKAFTFNLSAGKVETQGETSVPMPSTDDCTRQVKDGNTAQFGSITYYKTGKYTYTITETEDTTDPDKGWTYNVNGPVTATVEVKETSSGALYTEVSYSPANAAGTAGLITNKYEDGKLKVVKEAQLNGQKDTAASGATFKVGLFETADSTSPVETKTITIGNDGTGSVEFDHLVIGKTYYVYEMNGDQKAQNNSYLGSYKVVTGSGYGTVVKESESASASTSNTATISLVNNKEVGDLVIKKTVEGTSDTTKAFEFSITLTPPDNVAFDDTYQSVKTPQTGSEVAGTVNPKETIQVSLKTGESFTIKSLPAGTKYQVVETKVSGYTPDPANATLSGTISTSGATADFKNTYAASGQAKLFAKKTLQNKDLTAHMFQFKLTGPKINAEGEVVDNDGNGKAG